LTSEGGGYAQQETARMIQKEIDGQIFYVYGQLQMASSKKETLC
jgi:hypothetical protein